MAGTQQIEQSQCISQRLLVLTGGTVYGFARRFSIVVCSVFFSFSRIRIRLHALPPTEYARMLGERIQEQGVTVWLVNTGWTGGAFGTGQRMELGYTRALIRAVLDGRLADIPFMEHPIFGFTMPTACPGVPAQLLDPRQTWADADSYDQKALSLRQLFTEKIAAIG